MNATQATKKVFKLLDQFFSILKNGGEIEPLKQYEINEELSEEEFDSLMERIREEGFVNINGSTNTLSDYINYKEYKRSEEFEHLNDEKVKIFMEFYETRGSEGRSYLIKSISFGMEEDPNQVMTDED